MRTLTIPTSYDPFINTQDVIETLEVFGDNWEESFDLTQLEQDNLKALHELKQDIKYEHEWFNGIDLISEHAIEEYIREEFDADYSRHIVVDWKATVRDELTNWSATEFAGVTYCFR